VLLLSIARPSHARGKDAVAAEEICISSHLPYYNLRAHGQRSRFPAALDVVVLLAVDVADNYTLALLA